MHLVYIYYQAWFGNDGNVAILEICLSKPLKSSSLDMVIPEKYLPALNLPFLGRLLKENHLQSVIKEIIPVWSY